MTLIAMEIGSGLWGLMFKVFIIVMPLIMFLEWARAQPWFQRAVSATGVVFRPMGFRPESLFALLTGVLFGISYGAGVLIPQARSGEMDRRQIFLVAAFLGICHAIVEDTLLFVTLGANAGILVGTRVVAAMLVVFALSRMKSPGRQPQSASSEGESR
jgi:uncharacterized membrane protein (UPF0136 family)